jgi:hypothetical protein
MLHGGLGWHEKVSTTANPHEVTHTLLQAQRPVRRGDGHATLTQDGIDLILQSVEVAAEQPALLQELELILDICIHTHEQQPRLATPVSRRWGVGAADSQHAVAVRDTQRRRCGWSEALTWKSTANVGAEGAPEAVGILAIHIVIVRRRQRQPRCTRRERLAVRIGIATGLVVVGDMQRTGVRPESWVIGETPNLAARLQGLAAPGQIIVSANTRALLGSSFDIKDLGPQALRGIPTATTAYQIAGERAVSTRFDALLNVNRQRIHARLLSTLERRLDSAPQVMAQHAAQAGLLAEAIRYWQSAATQSLARPAYREAIAHLTQALESADRLEPGRDRDEYRLSLWVGLGQASIPLHGYGNSQTAAAFAQARQLAAAIGKSPHRFSIEYASWVAHYVRGEQDEALGTAHRIIEQAGTQEGLRLAGTRALGISQMMTGTPLQAAQTFSAAERVAQALRDRSEGRRLAVANRFAAEPEVATQFHVSLTLWSLGRIDDARSLAHSAVAAAREMGHAHTLGHALAHAAICAVVNHELPLALALSTETIEFSEKHEMELWRGYGYALHGFALALQGALSSSRTFFADELERYRDSVALEALRGPSYGLYAGPSFSLNEEDGFDEGVEVLASFNTEPNRGSLFRFVKFSRGVFDVRFLSGSSFPTETEEGEDVPVSVFKSTGELRLRARYQVHLSDWVGFEGGVGATSLVSDSSSFTRVEPRTDIALRFQTKYTDRAIGELVMGYSYDESWRRVLDTDGDLSTTMDRVVEKQFDRIFVEGTLLLPTVDLGGFSLGARSSANFPTSGSTESELRASILLYYPFNAWLEKFKPGVAKPMK